MRHLNGIYAQRYNRSKNTDESLFRGRYKAVMIEPGTYLLNVSRHIYLNTAIAGLMHLAEDSNGPVFEHIIGMELIPEHMHSKLPVDCEVPEV